MMKISFSLCSKPSSIEPLISSSPPSSPSSKVFITEFDQSRDPNAEKPKIIIPPISNEWTESIVKFQTTNSLLANVTDGLNHLTKTKTINRMSNVVAVSDQLKNDLERLPDDRGMAEFEDMPVEEFAAAYVRGYGWKPDKEVPSWVGRKKDYPFKSVLPYRIQTGLGFVEDKKSNAAAVAAKKEVMVSRKRSWEKEDKLWCCGYWSQEQEECL